MSRFSFVIQHEREEPELSSTEKLASRLNGDGTDFDIFIHTPEDRAANVVAECADDSKVQACCTLLRSKGFAVLTYGKHFVRPIKNLPREPVWSVPVEKLGVEVE